MYFVTRINIVYYLHLLYQLNTKILWSVKNEVNNDILNQNKNQWAPSDTCVNRWRSKARALLEADKRERELIEGEEHEEFIDVEQGSFVVRSWNGVGLSRYFDNPPSHPILRRQLAYLNFNLGTGIQR